MFIEIFLNKEVKNSSILLIVWSIIKLITILLMWQCGNYLIKFLPGDFVSVITKIKNKWSDMISGDGFSVLREAMGTGYELVI